MILEKYDINILVYNNLFETRIDVHIKKHIVLTVLKRKTRISLCAHGGRSNTRTLNIPTVAFELCGQEVLSLGKFENNAMSDSNEFTCTNEINNLLNNLAKHRYGTNNEIMSKCDDLVKIVGSVQRKILKSSAKSECHTKQVREIMRKYASDIGRFNEGIKDVSEDALKIFLTRFLRGFQKIDKLIEETCLSCTIQDIQMQLSVMQKEYSPEDQNLRHSEEVSVGLNQDL